MLVVERNGTVGGAQPQVLAHQRERGRVQAVVELDVAVPMHGHPAPATQVRRLLGQWPQMGTLQRKEFQRRHARGAMAAAPGFVHHPGAGLGVEVGQVAERAQRHEVALDVLDPGLDDALLLRVVRRARVDAKAVALGTLGVAALHLWVVGTGLGDGALGVVDDDALGDAGKPFEGTAVAAQPGGHRLVPDELHVLVAAVAQGHDKGPGAAHLPIGVKQHGASAEVDLGGLPGLEIQAHGGGHGLLLADLLDHAAH